MDVTKNRSRGIGLLFLLSLLGMAVAMTWVGSTAASPTVIYVRASATGANNGTSWADAYTSLQTALAGAISGQEIWVGAGTYSPGATAAATFTLKNGVAVYGGFPAAGGDWSTRDPAVNVSKLFGGGSHLGGGTNGHVVTSPADATSTAILDGFTVQGGDASIVTVHRGGGLLVYGSPTLRRLLVTENYSNNGGGGMFIDGGSPVLSDIVFKTNYGQFVGGGLALHCASPTMTDLTFRDNHTTSMVYGGGGLHVVGGHPTLTHALFADNWAAGYGGGIAVTTYSPHQQLDIGTIYPETTFALDDAVFANNATSSSAGGAAMSVGGGSVTLANVDFVGNQAGGAQGGALRVANTHAGETTTPVATMTNSIVWANTGGAQLAVGGSLTVSYSCVEGGCSGIPGVTSGPGNITTFPFVNSGDPGVAGDLDWDGLDNAFGTVDDGLRLANGSPAVDSASNAAVPGGVITDILGAPRIRDGNGDGSSIVDMGAFELRCPVTDGVVYVDRSATGANDGTSWADAFTDLQAGLALAGPGPTTQVWVAEGTYKPTSGTDRTATFALKSGVKIYGGFPATGDPGFADRDVATYVTTLSGDLGGNDGADFTNIADNVYHVVSAYGVDDIALLDGFTISGGNAVGTAPNGGGLYNKSGSPALHDLTIIGNAAVMWGGGMYTESGGPTLSEVVFSGNRATSMGGAGLHVMSGSATLTGVGFDGNVSHTGFGGGMSVGNTDDMEAPIPTVTLSRIAFTGNSAQWGGGLAAKCGNITMRDAAFDGNHSIYTGGGMYVGDPNWLSTYGGTMSLVNVRFCGNEAKETPATGYETGGAIALFDAAPTLTNVLFSGNHAYAWGGAVYSAAANPTLTNVTFNGNRAATGGAFYNDYGAATIRNSILWGDGGGEIAGPVAVTYSIVQGGYTGTGNSDVNPLFVLLVDPASAPTTAGNLRLQAGSPAIDTGNNASLPGGVSTDLDGHDRLVGTAVDRGAYEFDSVAPLTTDNADTGTYRSFTLVLSPTDMGWGVASTQYRIDGGAWRTGTSVTLRLAIRHKRAGLIAGVHTIEYFSTDQAGNVETIKSCQVTIR